MRFVNIVFRREREIELEKGEREMVGEKESERV
jgi:hypothetical protein